MPRRKGLWHDPSAEPVFSQTVELDLSTVVPSIAGPKRPQDRVSLSEAGPRFREALRRLRDGSGRAREHPGHRGRRCSTESFPASATRWPSATSGNGDSKLRTSSTTSSPRPSGAPSSPTAVTLPNGSTFTVDHGAVVIAAITSCTNTSNPFVMVAAALVAKKAVEHGLSVKPWVKTSLAPGSKVVSGYYDNAGLTPYLDKLGFNLVGYGCTTCIGNSGPLIPEISAAINQADLAAVSVLSGNRNFEGRISPDVKMNYLMSPPLVVAYALAGSMDVDLQNDPLGTDPDGKPVFLADIWPSPSEVSTVVGQALRADIFERDYADVFAGDATWQSLVVPTGDVFAWDADVHLRAQAPVLRRHPA